MATGGDDWFEGAARHTAERLRGDGRPPHVDWLETEAMPEDEGPGVSEDEDREWARDVVLAGAALYLRDEGDPVRLVEAGFVKRRDGYARLMTAAAQLVANGGWSMEQASAAAHALAGGGPPGARPRPTPRPWS